MGSKKIQAALEYLITYMIQIFIVVLVAGILFFFFIQPSLSAQTQCIFNSGVFCQDMIFGSSASASNVLVILSNTRPYALVNPVLLVGISQTNFTGKCVPNVIAPGGAIICNATIKPSQGAPSSAISGAFYFKSKPCISGTIAFCSNLQNQIYVGSFVTHISSYVSNANIVLKLQNATSNQPLGSSDKLTATLTLLGYPIEGADINFTPNKTYASAVPAKAATNGNGQAISYASSTQLGLVKFFANFSTYSANTVINFVSTQTYTVYTTAPISTLLSTTSTTSTSTTSTVLYIYCVGSSATANHNEAYYAPISSTGIGSWSAGTSYPIALTSAGCSIYNNIISCVGSLAGLFKNQIYYTSVSTSGFGPVWTLDTHNYPINLYGAGCSSYNNYIYCVGSNINPYNQVYYAPLSTLTGPGAWTSTTSIPAAFNSAGCSTSSGYIYCVGGDGSVGDNWVYYAPVSTTGIGAWSSTTIYPVSLINGGCSISNNLIYCVGTAGTANNNEAYYASISSTGIGTWSSTTFYPVALRSAGCIISNGYIYCVGTAGTTNKNEAYYAPISSTGIGTWSSTSKYPVALWGAYCQTTTSGGGYLGGGG